MIRKILKLQNVGLLQDATQNGAVDLAQVTAIYADNGRGKSTLATVLRACQLGDAGRLQAKKTIDATNDPEVRFLLPTGGHVDFTANVWTATLPDIVVFDSEFVEQNIYSGFEVRTDQRQSLLEFALGDKTVQLKKQIDQLTNEIATQTGKKTQAEKTLTGFATPYPVAQFITLQAAADAQQQIDALQKRIEAAKNIQQLRERKDPVKLTAIQFVTLNIFTVLKTRIQDIEKTAETAVKAHLAKHDVTSRKDYPCQTYEDWIGIGRHYYLNGSECPFCDQDMTGLQLIDAYRDYFNTAYMALKNQINDVEAQILNGLSDSNINPVISVASVNTARIEAWKDQIDLAVPILDESALMATIKQIRDQLLGLVTSKRSAPMEMVGSQEEGDTVTAMLKSVGDTITEYNFEIESATTAIREFKTKLAVNNTASLKAEVNRLEAAQKHNLLEVKAAIAEYKNAETERKRLDNEKIKAREQLDALMQTTLQQYQASINELLDYFRAEFSIEQLKPTYLGSGEPRTEYGLKMRNISVKLGSRADMTTGCSFATTLSEADKRTLAFSFFLARLKSDPNLASKLVVLDDPVSSFDRNRRHKSICLIANLVGNCRQLLVLSHDAYFVRELRERLANRKPAPIVPNIILIKRVQHGYSAFAECDIDDVCASEYYRHHRLVADYVDGKSTANTRDIAKAIRPLLEGYYHRRFPGKISRRLMFGQIIELAAKAQPGNPLAYLKPILKELGEVNDYVGQFHHDTNEAISVVDAELLDFSKRALTLIYQNG
jgi:wobble nucleotide-excising tRNase